jgi:hypothetical protein
MPILIGSTVGSQQQQQQHPDSQRGNVRALRKLTNYIRFKNEEMRKRARLLDYNTKLKIVLDAGWCCGYVGAANYEPPIN